MKKYIFMIFIIFMLFLSSCAEKVRTQEYICYHLGFDRIEENIVLSATLAEIGSISSQKTDVKLTPLSVIEADFISAFKLLREQFPNLYYKDTELFLFGNTLTQKDSLEIITLIFNDIEFPLKCKAVNLKAKTAQEQISEITNMTVSDNIYQAVEKIRFSEYAAGQMKMHGKG